MDSATSSKQTNLRWMRFSLRSFLILCVIAAASISLFVTRYQFEEFNDYYLVMMKDRVKFMGQPIELAVVLEKGKTAPTWRQRWLIYRMQSYGKALHESICDAADQHRINYEYMVGDLVEEYGLPEMNRQNIDEHFSVGMIYIPRQEGSPDDYVVLGCSCLWEDEHGMELMIKNGREAVWAGSDGPWQWESPWKFMQSQEGKNSNMGIDQFPE